MASFSGQESNIKPGSNGTITVTSQQLALDFVKKMRQLDLIQEDNRFQQTTAAKPMLARNSSLLTN
jgi:hypothetical protein